jgi:two-component system NtrC family sensor kinase
MADERVMECWEPMSDKTTSRKATRENENAALEREAATLRRQLADRDRDIAEVRDQQTASAEVLRTIASAPAEAERALDTIAKVAARLFGSSDVNIMRLEGGVLRHVAALGELASAVETAFPDRPLDPSSMPATAILERRPLHVADLSAPDVRARFPTARLPKKPGSAVAAPLMREGAAIGAIVLVRHPVRPFTDVELAQVQNFADQAVIAIENSRLLGELREALERQTATSDILRAIASSPGEAEGTLRRIAETTQRLTGAAGVSLRVADTAGEKFKVFIGVGQGAEEVTQQYYGNSAPRYTVRARTLPWTVVLENRQVHIPDLDNLDSELSDWPGLPVVRAAGIRTLVGTPLRSRNGAIGAMIVLRDERKPFDEDQLNLLQSFADQAAIAIENERLVSELREARDAAERSLENLKAAQESLIQAEKMASLGQLTAGIAHEIKNPLNFINNFAAVSSELAEELRELVEGIDVADAARGEIDELAQTIRGNLDKIEQHGQRADSIVKNMLLHARQGSSEHRLVDVNALVEESLNLAYHGVRAEGRGFDVTLERSLDPKAGDADLYPQEITRVLLNLIANGFYAMRKRRDLNSETDYEPVMLTATRDLGDRVEITIRDNGTGIAPDVRERLFTPFFTTKPAGEGTGLGLSISHDIVVKQHRGAIEIDSEPDKFTEFRIVLPRGGAGVAGGARP